MSVTTLAEFEGWLKYPEGRNLEFKEAKSQFNYQHDVASYCAALANEGGGKLVLGVNNKRVVVGSNAFMETYTQESNKLLNIIGLRVDVDELKHPHGRVVVFHVPSYHIGKPVKYKGVYWMRAGESLTPMDEQTLRIKLNEAEPDFTAGIVPGLTIADLDPEAIAYLREKWAAKSNRQDFLNFDDDKTLRNLELLDGSGVSYAALILVGKREVIRRELADAEVVFEWRLTPSARNYDFRAEWREPFVLADARIWQAITARNIRIPFQDGFLQREVWAFDEKSIREAVHNAVMHRDYAVKGRSIFIKASPESFNIESPGGLVSPVTLENILSEKSWRNRRLAEVLGKIGFAERSSQGMDDIFEQSIRDGKGLPSLAGTDAHTVRLSIPAQVKDRDFILYLERLSNDRQISLTFDEIYQLERIRESQKVERPDFKDKFLKLGLIEPVGKGRGVRYLLSRRYYETIGQSGRHTRIKGLSRDQIKELILNHIREGKPSSRADLVSGFSECSPKDLSNILQELKRAGKIHFEGSRIGGRWRMVY